MALRAAKWRCSARLRSCGRGGPPGSAPARGCAAAGGRASAEALIGVLKASAGEQAAYIEALESSVRKGNGAELVMGRAGERRGLEVIEQAQRKFLDESVPLGRRIRRALWKHAPLRPFSYLVEFSRLMLRQGPAQAARAVVVTSRLRASGAFDAGYYLKHSWDVRALGQDPVLHYVIAGAAEGRNPCADILDPSLSAPLSGRSAWGHQPVIPFRASRPFGRAYRNWSRP